jgi:hypothetical protein
LPIDESLTEEVKESFDSLAQAAVTIIYQERNELGVIKTVSAAKDFITYEFLRRISYNAWKLAERDFDGSYLNLTVAMAFSAFTLEAYLNHVGQHLFSYWKEIEKMLSPSGKLSIIVDKIDLPIDLGIRPFQSFHSIFNFRHKIVHGKTIRNLEVTNVEYILLDYEDPPIPEAPLEKLINRKNTKIFMEDTSLIIEIIHSKVWPGEYHFDSGFVEWSANISY